MRRSLKLFALMATVIAIAAVSSAAGSSSPPRLRMIKLSPLTVQGSHFKPYAHVKVTLISAARTTKRVRAGRHGRFTVTFSSAVVDRCSQWTMKAIQPGHAPVLILGPKPACPPA